MSRLSARQNLAFAPFVRTEVSSNLGVAEIGRHPIQAKILPSPVFHRRLAPNSRDNNISATFVAKKLVRPKNGRKPTLLQMRSPLPH
jgi:hypothetical protein